MKNELSRETIRTLRAAASRAETRSNEAADINEAADWAEIATSCHKVAELGTIDALARDITAQGELFSVFHALRRDLEYATKPEIV